MAVASAATAVLKQHIGSFPEPATMHIAEAAQQQQPAAAATETTIDAAAAAAAIASNDFDAQASSEAVNSTLMGIALLAYLQSNAKREAAGQASGSAPSTSKSAARIPLERTSSDRVPRRYQRMSPKDDDAPGEPLVRRLAAIKEAQSQAQYICKR